MVPLLRSARGKRNLTQYITQWTVLRFWVLTAPKAHCKLATAPLNALNHGADVLARSLPAAIGVVYAQTAHLLLARAFVFVELTQVCVLRNVRPPWQRAGL